MHESQPSEHIENSADESEFFEQDKKTEELRKQADAGAEKFYELSGVSPEHHISSEQKLLFSTISDDEDHSGFPVARGGTATFTALGLEYAGKRRPYSERYRQFIHRSVLVHYLSGATNVEELVDCMNSSYDWIPWMSSALEKKSRAEATDYYTSQFSRTRQSLQKMKVSEPEYKTHRQAWGITDSKDPAINEWRAYKANFDERLYQYLIESGAMTESERNEHDHYRTKKEALVEKLIGLCFDDDESKLKQEIRNFENTMKTDAFVRLEKEKLAKEGDKEKPKRKLSEERTYPENMPEIARSKMVDYINEHISSDLREEAITVVDKLGKLTTTYHYHKPLYNKFKRKFEGKNYKKGDTIQDEIIKKETRSFLVSRNLMTAAEVSIVENYHAKRKMLVDRIVYLCLLGNEDKLRHLIQNQSNGAKLVAAQAIRRDEHSPFADRQQVYNGLMQEVSSRYVEARGDSYPDNLPEIEKKRIESFLDERCPDGRREVAAQLLEELSELETRYATHLRPKYIDAREAFGNPHAEEIRRIETRLKEMQSKRSQIIDGLTEKRIKEKIIALKAKIASVAMEGYNAEDGEVGVFPTGLLIVSDGKPTVSPVSPMDKKILEVMREAGVDETWISFWTAHQSDCDKVARKALVTTVTAGARLIDDEFGKRVRDYSEKHQVDFPPAVSIETGKIPDSMQPGDFEMLTEFLPAGIVDFVDEVDLKYPTSEATLKSTRLEALRFLNGQTMTAPGSMTLCDSDRVLELRVMESIVDAEPEKIEKIIGRVIVQVGAANYLGLSAPKKQIFRNLLGRKLNISDLQFYKYFGRRSAGAEDKRSVLERTMFIKCFMDYLDGKASPTMAKFFDSLKKKPAISEES